MLLGGAIVVVGLAPELVVAGGALLATGLLATGTMTLLNAGLQLGTPDAVRGHVLSLYTVLAAGMPMLGGWALGSLMAADPRLALVAAGAILTSLAIVLSRLARGPIGVGG